MPSPIPLVETILPRNRIHLCAGISSAGKTKFWLPQLLMWEAGMPVIGFKSNPEKWCLVSCDRPKQDVIDSLESSGLKEDDVNLISAFGEDSKPDYKIIEIAKAKGCKLLFWEGLDYRVKNPNNQWDVTQYLSGLTAHCQKDDLTILGTVGVAKLKPHETYQNPRQLVAGASVWERATSTDFVIVATNPGDIEDPHRLMYVCLKQKPSFAVEGCFDHEKLNFNPFEQRISGPALQRLQAKMQGRRVPKDLSDEFLRPSK